MSSFYCEHCGTECQDTPRGYITGCEHYPADIDWPNCHNETQRMEDYEAYLQVWK